MSDICQWLDEPGLGPFAGTLEVGRIDVAALFHVTEADPEETGLRIGPHRTFLVVIAEGLDAGHTASHISISTCTNNAQAHKAERRHTTVMFYELVGSFDFRFG